ncbi:MAG: hypothetical protein K2K31_02740, partial [Clostridia bacterium]|nr:hypothetical protein [Clostridia bacterium]
MARIKNRLKKNSIMNFVAVAVLTLLGIILSVCSFNIPFTTYTYNGFANSISLGLDLAGGISVVYKCDIAKDSNTNDLDIAIDATVTRLENVLGSDFSEATVVRQDGDKIRIEVPSVTDAEEVFKRIGDPQPLRMTLKKSTSDEDIRIRGTDISNVQATYQKKDDSSNEYVHGVSVTFTSEGARKFESLTDEASKGDGEIYIYFGDKIEDENDCLTLQCSQKITGGSTFISGNFNTHEEAEQYALQIMSGTFNVSLEIISSDVISATLGVEALKLAIIGGLVGFVLILVLLW